MQQIMRPLILLSLILTAAFFGFFYAWVCSTMWGLDGADPRIAIAAMQAMNGSVRNAAFAPVFFGTPVVLLITTLIAFLSANRLAATFLACATILTGPLGVLLTMLVHIPMNEALALVTIPENVEAAHQIWLDYSPDWQIWNQTRTLTSGLAVLCIGLAMLSLNKR